MGRWILGRGWVRESGRVGVYENTGERAAGNVVRNATAKQTKWRVTVNAGDSNVR